MSTGYHANLAAVTALVDRDCLVVSDAHVHASLVDAIRLSRAEVADRRPSRPRGDLGRPGPRGRPARARRGRVGLLGARRRRRRCPSSRRCARRTTPCCSSTRPTAWGWPGPTDAGSWPHTAWPAGPTSWSPPRCPRPWGPRAGWCSAVPALVEHLVNTARPFIFDTGLAPAAAGAARAALDLVRSQPSLPARAQERMRALAGALGVPPVAGAVLSVPMPSPQVALAAAGRGARGGRAGRLLPAAVGAGRRLAAADHRRRRAARRRVGPRGRHRRPGRQGARRTGGRAMSR